MKYLVLLLSIVASSSALASGGFLWLHDISHALHLPDHTVTFLLTSVLFILAGLAYRAKSRTVEGSIIPSPKVSYSNIFESVGEFIYNLSRQTMGDSNAKTYFPLMAFYFMFIFLNNLIGFVPGFMPPTENFNTGFALGIFIFIYYNWEGVKAQGVIGHLKHFAGPILVMAPLIFVLELISHV